MTDNELKEEILRKNCDLENVPLPEYDTTGLTLSINEIFKCMEQYHLARLEAITDGEIAKTALKKIPINPVTFKDIPMSSSKRKGFEWGANWVLKKLKDNDLFK